MKNPVSGKRNAILLAASLFLSVTGAQALTLRIATDQMPPYEDLANTAAPGFSTEVITGVLRAMKMDFSINTYPWDRALKMVYAGDEDALYSAFWSAERAQKCIFPREPLIHGKWVFFIRKSDSRSLKFASYNDLIGKRIGVLRGAAISPEFWAFINAQHNAEIGTFDEQNFKKLLANRVDYVVASYENGMALLTSMGIRDQVVPLAGKSIAEQDVFIIFSKNTVTQEQVDQFSDALKKFKTTAAYRKIYNKYFDGRPAE